MITFARLFHPAVICTIAGQPVQALGIPGVQAPRVAFRITRTMSSTPDSASLSVYGLDEPRRKSMQAIWTELGSAFLLLSTGYDGVTVRLFAGDVRSLEASALEGAEIVTRATADDGGDAISDAVIPPGLASTAGIDAKTMIEVALACINSPAAYVPPAAPPETPIVSAPCVAATLAGATPQATTLFYTAVGVGKARDLLDEAARMLGARWWIRDSLLYMTARQAPIDAVPILLPRTHWLTEPSEDGAGQIKVATFLDPNLVPGRQVVLVGRAAPGSSEVLRIEAGEYTGDSDSATPFRADLVLRRQNGLGL